MRVDQTPSTILTKCSKMTEEKHKKHGMNGTADGAFAKEDSKTNYTQGGRLKFFKDGKFILELERAREGERVSWVSVPRKTFWPPQGTAASTPTYRQESSTSLSVSDDNSSIQSSPWQRDHSWKQTTPRRDQSKEMCFYYWCPKRRRRPAASRGGKRRRPYSTALEDSKVPSQLARSSRSKKDSGQVSCNNNVNLLAIVQTLTEKRAASGTPPRVEAAVSPRKRFLREMEKDRAQQDDSSNCQKRSRNKTPQTQQGVQTVAVAASPVTSMSAAGSVATAATGKVGSPVRAAINGTSEEASSNRPPRNCSYSITSLLADDRTPRRSPNNSPSHYASTTQPQQYCSPTSEDRWFSESVDRLRSIELSQADKRTYPSYHHPPYLGQPFVYPYSIPPFYNQPGMYGRYMVPPIYPAPPMPFAVRSEAPSCSWVSEPPRETDHRDDNNIADMPLNLSKH